MGREMRRNLFYIAIAIGANILVGMPLSWLMGPMSYILVTLIVVWKGMEAEEGDRLDNPPEWTANVDLPTVYGIIKDAVANYHRGFDWFSIRRDDPADGTFSAIIQFAEQYTRRQVVLLAKLTATDETHTLIQFKWDVVAALGRGACNGVIKYLNEQIENKLAALNPNTKAAVDFKKIMADPDKCDQYLKEREQENKKLVKQQRLHDLPATSYQLSLPTAYGVIKEIITSFHEGPNKFSTSTDDPTNGWFVATIILFEDNEHRAVSLSTDLTATRNGCTSVKLIWTIDPSSSSTSLDLIKQLTTMIQSQLLEASQKVQ